MKKYKRLQGEEREEISRMLSQKCTFTEIAQTIGRSVSTVSREVSGGSCNRYTYRAKRAESRALRNMRKRRKGKFLLDLNKALQHYVYEKLRLKWSPVRIYSVLSNNNLDFCFAICV